MKKWRIYMIFALLLCLTATGCGKDKDKKQDSVKSVKKEAVLMAVGKDTVSSQEAMAYLYLLKRQYETSLGKDIWSLKMGGEKDFEDYAKEAVISHLTQLKIICQEAEKEGVSLDEEERYEAGKAARALLETASEEDVKQFELSEEVLTEVYADNTLAARFFDVTTAEVDTNISDEEAKQITIQYISVNTEGLTGKQKKDAKKEAKALYKKAKETTSFLNLAASNSDSDTVELTFGREDMPEEFGQAAMELKTGEISPLIEGEKGYYILYCITDFDEKATTAKKEAVIDAKRDTLFREKYKEWSGEHKVVVSTALWNEISFTQEIASSEQE